MGSMGRKYVLNPTAIFVRMVLLYAAATCFLFSDMYGKLVPFLDVPANEFLWCF